MNMVYNLTAREFHLLLLLEKDRYYNLLSLKALFEKSVLLYSDALPYLHDNEPLCKIVYELLRKDYLTRIRHPGCYMLFRLSARALAHAL